MLFKRGSSVLEYMLVYGIAMFGIAAVVGVLSGINISNSSPQSSSICISSTFPCHEYLAYSGKGVSTGGLYISVYNGFSDTISLASDLTEATILPSQLCPEPTIYIYSEVYGGWFSTSDPEVQYISYDTGEKIQLRITCADIGRAKTIKSTISISYIPFDKQFIRQESISLNGLSVTDTEQP